MREMLVERQEMKGQGSALRCRYSVLVESIPVGNFFCEHYGVKIEEESTGDTAGVPGLTCSAAEIDELVEKLIRHRVTPTGLSDVLSDWKKRK